MKTLFIPEAIVKTSLLEIKHAGGQNREGFGLWLGKRNNHVEQVTEFYVPEYVSGSAYYSVTPTGNKNLMNYLLANRLAVLAQIHSHPDEAFHSKADDELATVTHGGGLSFVVPFFGENLNPDNFSDMVQVYQLTQDGNWIKANPFQWAVSHG